MDYILLIVGFLLLIKGADFFVEGSSKIAKVLNVSSVVIGLTLVALGTSLPELSVSLIADMNNSSNLSISNIIGSNMFNLFIILGVCAIFNNLKIKEVEYKYLIASGISFIVMIILYHFINGHYILGRIGGLFLIIILISYFYIVINKSINEIYIKEKWNYKYLFLLITGLIMIIMGGKITVRSSINIARMLGVSERVIGLTIVAIGTSLPELITSIVAIIKKDGGIAVGNIIGSNVLNILLIGGICSVLLPIELSKINVIDFIIYISGTLLLYLGIIRNNRITKREGILMIIYYLFYFIYAWIR